MWTALTSKWNFSFSVEINLKSRSICIRTLVLFFSLSFHSAWDSQDFLPSHQNQWNIHSSFIQFSAMALWKIKLERMCTGSCHQCRTRLCIFLLSVWKSNRDFSSIFFTFSHSFAQQEMLNVYIGKSLHFEINIQKNK